VALLALIRLSERRQLRARLAWTTALAGACAMVILAGEPRAIDDGVVVIGMYALWRAWRLGRRSGGLAFVGFVSAGVVLGVALGAVQWLPGIDAVQTSQRAVHSTALFDSGSLAPKWLLLSIVPGLFGGSGSFGQPTYFASYGLSEVTGYVGLLPLVAAFALLGRLRWRQRLPEWVIWHLIALVGVLLALGGNTVLGPVLVHLPLFGDQRLQSRNIMIADLALAVLLAYWVDIWLRGARSRRRFPEPRQLLGLVPAVAAVAVVTVTLAWGAGMLRWLGLSAGMANQAGPSAPWLVPFLVLGLAAIAVVLWGQRLGRRNRERLVVCVVAVDVLIFTLLTVVQVAPGLTHSQPPGAPSSSALASSDSGIDAAPPLVPVSDLVHGGRFAVYDPGELDVGELSKLGVSDANVMTGTPSVEGYSSIVDNTYAQVTGSHQAMGYGQNVLDPTAIANGTLDQLDTTVLLTPSAYLITADTTTPDPTDTGQRHLATNQSATWYLGTPLDVTSVTVPVDGTPTDDPGIRVGLVGQSGSTLWDAPVVVSGQDLQVSVDGSRDIVAVRVVAGARGIDLGPPVVATVEGATYTADGQLQDALVPPRWRFGSIDGDFAVFDDSMARPVLTLRAEPGQATTGASVRATGGPRSEPTRAQVSSPAGITVVRAVAAIPGWTARWYPAGSAVPQALSVRRSGVVQVVTVPPGRGTVAWSYVAPGARLGIWLSLGGLVVVAGLNLGALAWRRRSRPTCDASRGSGRGVFARRCRPPGTRDDPTPWRPARGADL
jgi:hypothetical protein